MNQLKCLFAVIIVTLLLIPSFIHADLSLTLSVSEPAGVERKSEPASGGIPLPWEIYKADQPFRLLSAGKEIPAQILPLVTDEKGFLRWILVDTQLDLPANGNIELQLEAAPAKIKHPAPLKITQNNDAVIIDNGKAVFTFSKTAPFSLFSQVTSNGKTVAQGASASYIDATDQANPKTCIAAAPDAIELFDAGPMRATLKISGPFTGDDETRMRYIAWITLWAGQSRALVKYSLANSNPDKFVPLRFIDESRIAIRIPGATDVGGPGPFLTSGNVSVHDLLFEVKQPRKLEVVKGELLLRGITPMAETNGKTAAISRSIILIDSSHYSSQYMFNFDIVGVADNQQADRNRLHILAPLPWYFETGGLAVGKFGTQADEFACYDIWKWGYDKSKAPIKPGYKMPERRYVHWEDNHYESEADVLEALVLMYLRTGGRSFYNTAEGWADYNMDLQTFRTDGWLYRDGGVWWNSGGPSLGNRAQRAKDPVTGLRDNLPNPWYKNETIGVAAVSKNDITEIDRMSDSKQCHCHCYGAGLAAWFCITGERDALEAAIDSVEQNYDTQQRAFRKTPGKSGDFSRDFTRSSYLTHAIRLVAPQDELVCKASDFLNAVYVQRAQPEPRGFVPRATTLKDVAPINKRTENKGEARMKELGIELKDGMLRNPQTGKSWQVVLDAGSWMFIYQAAALELYYRITRNEDAMDHAIAYGQAVAHVLFQPKHSNLAYNGIVIDFPTRGFAWDQASWAIPDGVENGEGIKINGYLACFHPDICARAYSLSGEPFLKQRAYDYWWGGSHRGYNAIKMHNLGSVGTWVNINGDHDEYVIQTGRTYYEWAYPRKDQTPPEAVKNLAIKRVNETDIEVTFTAPADTGGGNATRYQLKYADKEIVDYETFLARYNNFEDENVCNWFLAYNVDGEPTPQKAKTKERFIIKNIPETGIYFAIRTFDDSSNRSPISNIAKIQQ